MEGSSKLPNAAAKYSGHNSNQTGESNASQDTKSSAGIDDGLQKLITSYQLDDADQRCQNAWKFCLSVVSGEYSPTDEQLDNGILAILDDVRDLNFTSVAGNGAYNRSDLRAFTMICNALTNSFKGDSISFKGISFLPGPNTTISYEGAFIGEGAEAQEQAEKYLVDNNLPLTEAQKFACRYDLIYYEAIEAYCTLLSSGSSPKSISMQACPILHVTDTMTRVCKAIGESRYIEAVSFTDNSIKESEGTSLVAVMVGAFSKNPKLQKLDLHNNPYLIDLEKLLAIESLRELNLKDISSSDVSESYARKLTMLDTMSKNRFITWFEFDWPNKVMHDECNQYLLRNRIIANKVRESLVDERARKGCGVCIIS